MFATLPLRAALVLFGALCLQPSRAADLPKVASGRLERLALFPSQFVDARNVDVWLPANYDGKRRFKVLYMHDGQMLFDAGTTWNKQSWQVSEVLGELIAKHRVDDTIVVGVWNTDKLRASEYMPAKALDYAPPAVRARLLRERMEGKARADAYLRFLVEELKPAIDRRFATRPGREDTMIMGSSMGGLISWYAISEYPQVFGAAACLSTHWTGFFEQNASIPLAMLSYLQAHLPDPATHRLYMDTGTATLDALYPVHQSEADVLITEHGYDASHFRSRLIPGAAHTENDWAQRLADPLTFLIGPARAQTP